MRYRQSGRECVFGLAMAVAAQLISSAHGDESASTTLDGSSVGRLSVASGFTVEQVAGPPLVERPMMASFDDRGRLFVCDSSGFNLIKGSSEILVNNPPHVIRMLVDTDGDGHFDRSTVFADKMTFPMGALWHDGALYVASAPSLWRLKDTDGDGVADERREFVTKFAFGGNGCDVHGPFLGPDGRIYWASCQRAFEIPRPDGSVLKGKAAGVFRIRPDGEEVEMMCAGGFDNPVEVAFTDEGESFATVNLFIGNPRPRQDAIIHCVEGGLFPYQKLSPSFSNTGDLLPSMIDLGWVAPVGLMRIRSNAFGDSYRDNLFSTQFNTRRVVRHVIERSGATFRGTTEDFLVSPDPDFHPTDVIEDADGSFLVVDTGGWFIRGCPTSQIAKPEIKGAIYRIRSKDSRQTADPRGLAVEFDKLTSQQLVGFLDDPRWVVRDRTVDQLSRRGADAIPVLEGIIRHSPSITARRNAVWGLTRISNIEARPGVRSALADESASVRLSATNSVSLWRDADAVDKLQVLALNDESPAVRREAATALGRIGRSEAVPALLDALRSGEDRFLEHAQIYALIRIADRAATLKGLADSVPRVRRAALLALDQMENGDLPRDQVVALLEDVDASVRRSALTAIMSRPEWAESAAGLLRRRLAAAEMSIDDAQTVKAALLALCTEPIIQAVVADALHTNYTSSSVRALLLEVITEATVKQLPASWGIELRQCLEGVDEPTILRAVAAVRTRDESQFDESLVRLAKNPQQTADVRLAALGAIAQRLDPVPTEFVNFLRSQLDGKLPTLTRLAAASAIGNLRMSDDQRLSLCDVVALVGAIELPYLMAAFESSQNPIVGRAIVLALEKSPIVDSLPLDALRRALQGFPPEILESAQPLLQRLQADAGAQNQRLAELEPVLSGGNKAQGRTIFFGAKASCSACHVVASVGGRFGPDLSKIGNIRTPRDLLESIVVPSSSIARGYESYSILTLDGQVLSGTIGNNAPDAVTLITTERVEKRIARSDIDEIHPSRVSIMPKGLDAQLTGQELSDLMAYLTSLK